MPTAAWPSRGCATAQVVEKLFADLGPRFKARPGGYTRILRMMPRPGDSAPMALMQLVDGPAPVAAEEPTEGKKKSARRAKAAGQDSAKPKRRPRASAGSRGRGARRSARRKKKTPLRGASDHERRLTRLRPRLGRCETGGASGPRPSNNGEAP